MKLGISVPFEDGANPSPSGEEKIDRCCRRGQGCHPQLKPAGLTGKLLRFSTKAMDRFTQIGSGRITDKEEKILLRLELPC